MRGSGGFGSVTARGGGGLGGCGRSGGGGDGTRATTGAVSRRPSAPRMNPTRWFPALSTASTSIQSPERPRTGNTVPRGSVTITSADVDGSARTFALLTVIRNEAID